MAEKSGISDLFKRKGAAATNAWKGHKNDDTKTPSGGELPGGIEGGIAQLVSIKMVPVKEGLHKGEVAANLQAVVLHPVMHEGRKVQGLRTSQYIPMYDTPESTSENNKTFDQHMALTARGLGRLRQRGAE